jgi:protein required for attachment to host cells
MTYDRQIRRNPTAWIVVADRAQARIFAAHWPDLDPFEEIAGLENPEGQLQAREVDSDAFGRFRSPDRRGVSMGPDNDHRHQTAASFADEIVDFLEKGRKNNEFGHLVIIAPSMVLGELRSGISASLGKLREADCDKAIVGLSMNEIREHVQTMLDAAHV